MAIFCRLGALQLATFAPTAILLSWGCSSGANVLPGAEPMSCGDQATHRTLRIDHLAMARTHDQANAAALDIDGDGTAENLLGNAIVSVTVIAPELEDTDPVRLDDRLASDLAWLIEIEQCDRDARVTVARGEVDDQGRVHVADDGQVAAGGSAVAGSIDVELGIGVVPLGALVDFSDTGATGWHPMFPANLHIDLLDGAAEATIAGASGPGFFDVIVEPFHAYAQAQVEVWGPIFDDDNDGEITLAELRASGLVTGFVRADVDVGGDVLAPPDRPALDGVSDSMSFGFKIHAVDVDVE
jgi:hypothetical protein